MTREIGLRRTSAKLDMRFGCERSIVIGATELSQRHALVSAVVFATILGLNGFPTDAHAAVTISSSATQNMSCVNGVCAPTATDAVLNVGDLEMLLAAGNVEVTTTGSGVQATNIDVAAALSWAEANGLTLDAYQSATIERPVSVTGQGGLSITTNDGGGGGLLLFLQKANVTFANLSSTLTINGTSYTLEGTLPTLAAAIANNPSGAFALANSYDASQDGTYSTSPIPTVFAGSFSGLGNSISKLSIDDIGSDEYLGLFTEIGPDGLITATNLIKVNMRASSQSVGGVVGLNEGTIANTAIAGTIVSSPPHNVSGVLTGGLAGVNYGGMIMLSYADVSITTDGQNGAGGLVGGSTGSMVQSYSDGSISVGTTGIGGGLAAGNGGSTSQSYSTASVSGQKNVTVGGLLGENDGTVDQAYSTGRVKDQGTNGRNKEGGFVGYDSAPHGSITSAYWDTTTSHIRGLGHGAGTPRNDPGIKGLTTRQLQAGLPSGFDPTIWAEDKKINSGLPYLINNPPQGK